MSLGLGIFLLVVGAILKFAVRTDTSGLDLQMVGVVCMAAGALSLVLSFVLLQMRRRTTHTQVVEHGGVAAAPAVVADRPVVAEPVVSDVVIDQRR